MVRDGVEKLGIDQTDAESWTEGVEAYPDEKREYVISPDFRSGFGVSYDGINWTPVIVVSVSDSESHRGSYGMSYT